MVGASAAAGAWRKRVGVEPTKDRLTAPPGFEVRTHHRMRLSSKLAKSMTYEKDGFGRSTCSSTSYKMPEDSSPIAAAAAASGCYLIECEPLHGQLLDGLGGSCRPHPPVGLFGDPPFGHLPVASVCQGLDGAGSPTGCIQLAETVAPEVCILAVVISGLSVISVARRESTIWTYLLVLFAVIALILGALL